MLRAAGGLTWDENLCQRDVVVWHKDHLEQVPNIRVTVDLGTDSADHLDDLLGPLIPRGCLAAYHTRPWYHLHAMQCLFCCCQSLTRLSDCIAWCNLLFDLSVWWIQILKPQRRLTETPPSHLALLALTPSMLMHGQQTGMCSYSSHGVRQTQNMIWGSNTILTSVHADRV